MSMRPRWSILVFTLVLLGVGACSKEGDGGMADRFAIPPLDPDLVVKSKTDSTARASIPLAFVDGEPLEAGVLESQLKILLSEETRNDFGRNPNVLQIALSGVIDQWVLAKKAEEIGIGLSQEEKNMIWLKEIQLISDRYLKTVVKEKAKLSMEEAREFYDGHQQNYLTDREVQTRHILVNSQAQAELLQGAIEGGADFRQVCLENSQDRVTNETGGFQGWLKRGREVIGVGKEDAYIDFAVGLDDEEVGIFESPKGWHVVQVTESRGGDLIPFEDVAEGIRIDMGKARWPETYNEVCLNLRAEYAASMSQEGMEAYTQVNANVQRLFAEAASQDQPEGRIELWRKIVFDYPTSDFAAEAQFMIAYTYFRYLRDDFEANRHLGRLAKRYAESNWAKAGEYLQTMVDPEAKQNFADHAHDEYGGHDFEPREIEEPYEILQKVSSE